MPISSSSTITWTRAIDCNKFLSKAKYSPFHGRRVSARVDLTMVRGETVYADGTVDEDAQRGPLFCAVAPTGAEPCSARAAWSG